LSRWLSGEPRVKLRLLGVGVSQLATAEQLELFRGETSSAAPAQAAALDMTLDRIRERFGMQAMRRASSIRNR
jgi:hypothetical protein